MSFCSQDALLAEVPADLWGRYEFIALERSRVVEAFEAEDTKVVISKIVT